MMASKCKISQLVSKQNYYLNASIMLSNYIKFLAFKYSPNNSNESFDLFI